MHEHDHIIRWPLPYAKGGSRYIYFVQAESTLGHTGKVWLRILLKLLLLLFFMLQPNGLVYMLTVSYFFFWGGGCGGFKNTFILCKHGIQCYVLLPGKKKFSALFTGKLIDT